MFDALLTRGGGGGGQTYKPIFTKQRCLSYYPHTRQNQQNSFLTKIKKTDSLPGKEENEKQFVLILF